MRNTLLVALLLTAPSIAFAQGYSQGSDHTGGGCGPGKTQFEVKTTKSRPATAQPPDGKALVYVIQTAWREPGLTVIGSQRPVTRVGLDGSWVGANHGDSYITFTVDPGSHSICTDWQSAFSQRSDLASAADLEAEAGGTYYFRVKVRDSDSDGQHHNRGVVNIELVDASEGRLLLGNSEFATSTPKK